MPRYSTARSPIMRATQPATARLYALLDDGTVWAWGDGRQGELGTGPNPRLPLLANSTRAMDTAAPSVR